MANYWPLNEEMKEVIGNSYDQIANLLRVDAKLIKTLVSEGCFKREQLKNVTGTTYEKSTKLLDKFKRSDIRNLNRFVRCLRVMRPEVVPLLTGEAGKNFRKKMLASACD
jgi:hypothetical protein